jgi:hypothetical protein
MSPKDNNKQVSAAVRILQQKRDASARATHLMVKNDSLITYEKAISDQADKGKFPESTFLERKIMSTKTSFKRIALVAASALAIAGFSAVPANATNAGTATFTVDTATGTTTNTATKTVVTGTYVAATITFVNTVDNVNTITSTGVGTIQVPTIVAAADAVATTGVTATGATVYAAQATTSVPGSSAAAWTLGDLDGSKTGASTDGTLNISATSTVAGTQTITVTGSAGISTLVLTWGAAAAPSPAASTVYYVETATPSDSAIRAATYTKDSTGAVINTAGTTAGVIRVLINNDQAPAAGVDNETVSVTASGVGLVKKVGGTYSQADSDVTANSGYVLFYVAGSGISGTGTYTVTHTKKGVSTVLATKTVNFYGTTPTAATTKQNLSIGAAGGGALGVATTGANTGTTVSGTPAVLLTLKDKNGFVVGGQEGRITAATSNALVLSKTVVVDEDDSASAANAAGAGNYIVQPTFAATAKSGDTATLTITWTSADGLTKVDAAPVAFTVGGSMATGSVSAAFDKTDYVPGEALSLIFTAKDSKNNPIFDQDITDLIVDPVVFNYATGIAQTAVNFGFVGGKSSLKGYAPLAGGAIVASATYDVGAPTLQQATKIAAEAAVTSDATASLALDAANAATDAANNAYDEAQNATQAASDALAAVTALAKQVKSLIASVKKLTAAVAKLR